MNIAQKIALIFTLIGGINWGLIGLFNFNLVDFVLMSNSIATRIVYSIVGFSALFNIILLFLKFETNMVSKKIDESLFFFLHLINHFLNFTETMIKTRFSYLFLILSI